MTEQKDKKGHVFCPFCDEEIMSADLPWCQACKVTVFYCPDCRQPVPREEKACPSCGAEIKGQNDAA